MKLSKLLLFCLLLAFSSCSVRYSFRGVNLSDDVNTLSVATFFNDTGQGPPNMGQTFSEQLRDYFQRNTKLEMVQTNGDLQFEGAISSYDVRPQAIVSTGNQNESDQSGLMRLTIGVEAVYTNLKDETVSFKRRFSFFADYDPETTDLTTAEDQLVEEIFDQIIFDIFNASVATW